jgi:hypothetical protein
MAKDLGRERFAIDEDNESKMKAMFLYYKQKFVDQATQATQAKKALKDNEVTFEIELRDLIERDEEIILGIAAGAEEVCETFINKRSHRNFRKLSLVLRPFLLQLRL